MTRLVDSDEPPHPVVAQALGEADEVVADAFVAPRSEADGRTVAELALHTTTGMEVLAIQQRARRWVYRPRPSRRLAADDRLLTLGPLEGVDWLRELCGDDRPSDELVTRPPNEDTPTGRNGERRNPSVRAGKAATASPRSAAPR